MALGCRFYLAIAKIRAARKLWADVIEACGGSADVQRMRLRVSTGRRVLTTRNQLLNILRNTVACYAGAVADADIITTTPFDAPTGLPTEASRHNARNTQHILAEECYLAQVVDPAGGSWYIEWYSNEAASSLALRRTVPEVSGSRRPIGTAETTAAHADSQRLPYHQNRLQ